MRTKKIAYIRNERVYGFVVWKEKNIYHKKILEVLFFYMQKDNHARIGAQIMRDLELYAKENEFYVITLIPDDDLIEFYKHFGFSIYELDMFDNKPKMRKKINKDICIKKIRSDSQTKYYNETLPKELQNESNYESLDKFFS